MTSPLRVVLYAEGAGETGTFAGHPRTPGHPLEDDKLGPAHHLVRRCIGDRRRIRFDAPLRTKHARQVVGSDLHRCKTVKQLLVWADPALAPDLALILVDNDGDRERRKTLQACIDEVRTLSPLSVLAVAVEEFEAWLIADIAAVNGVLGTKHPQTPNPESMRSGEAKEVLTRWIAQSSKTGASDAVRAQIVAAMDFDRVGRSCGSFKKFRDDLLRAVADARS